MGRKHHLAHSCIHLHRSREAAVCKPHMRTCPHTAASRVGSVYDLCVRELNLQDCTWYDLLKNDEDSLRSRASRLHWRVKCCRAEGILTENGETPIRRIDRAVKNSTRGAQWEVG